MLDEVTAVVAGVVTDPNVVVAGVPAVVVAVAGDGAGVETDGAMGVATGVAIGVTEATAAGVGVVDELLVVICLTGVSTGGELGADIGGEDTVGDAQDGTVSDAQEGAVGEAHEGSEEEEEERALIAAFMLSNLFSNHWYNLFLSTGTSVSINTLHLSSTATILPSLGGITGGCGGAEGVGV